MSICVSLVRHQKNSGELVVGIMFKGHHIIYVNGQVLINALMLGNKERHAAVGMEHNTYQMRAAQYQHIFDHI